MTKYKEITSIKAIFYGAVNKNARFKAAQGATCVARQVAQALENASEKMLVEDEPSVEEVASEAKKQNL